MVHSTDIVELELKSKKFSLSVKKKEALEQPEPVYAQVRGLALLSFCKCSLTEAGCVGTCHDPKAGWLPPHIDALKPISQTICPCTGQGGRQVTCCAEERVLIALLGRLARHSAESPLMPCSQDSLCTMLGVSIIWQAA